MPQRLTSEQKKQVDDYKNLVWFVIRRFGFLPTGVDDYDDLYQVGCVGLIKAAKRYDADRGYAFTSFAVAWIRGELRYYERQKKVGKRIVPKSISMDAIPHNSIRPYADRIADKKQLMEDSVIQRVMLHEVLSMLRNRDPDGILRSWIMGETPTEISNRIGCTKASVKSKLERLKKTIRAEWVKNG